jgi:hypothetical protein
MGTRHREARVVEASWHPGEAVPLVLPELPFT